MRGRLQWLCAPLVLIAVSCGEVLDPTGPGGPSDSHSGCDYLSVDPCALYDMDPRQWSQTENDLWGLSEDGECLEIKNELLNLFYEGKIRAHTARDGYWAHHHGLHDNGHDIHLSEAVFATTRSERQRTLVHELRHHFSESHPEGGDFDYILMCEQPD